MSDIEMEPFVLGRSGWVFCFFTLQPLFSSFFVCETDKRLVFKMLKRFKPEK